MLVIGIDTCGASGSTALGRLVGEGVEILGQLELAGRTYSATLVAAVGDLLKEHGVELHEVGCLVVVSGPGSFTGVRVGLSAAKGFAEGAEIPVIAVSRLEVLSAKAGVANAALDAHRHEVFLRLAGRELLAGSVELAAVSAPEQCAVCDENATGMLAGAWPSTALVQVGSLMAADALRLAAPLIGARQFADVALLDGHYLRRSDAEIFGDAGTKGLNGTVSP